MSEAGCDPMENGYDPRKVERMYRDHIEALEAERDRLREALKGTLASLVATTSLIIRAEDAKKQPSKVVASDTMFRQMLVDYDNATREARAALSPTPGTSPEREVSNPVKSGG